MIGRERMLETMHAALRDADGDGAEIVLVAGRRDLSRCANSVIHQSVSAEDTLTVARVVRDRRIGSAFSHGFSAKPAASGGRVARVRSIPVPSQTGCGPTPAQARSPGGTRTEPGRSYPAQRWASAAKDGGASTTTAARPMAAGRPRRSWPRGTRAT